MSKLYEELGQTDINPMLQKFMEFKNSFRGNPKEEVMKMLRSGKISQSQLNALQNTARQIQAMMQR